ncbi:hypothetical protein LEN26_009091 [Aphanomyces euteiches]|nr:hypothetical protein AeMF1_006927 [Aphanomyces euteiches]KAH9128565.1 hypothetical protein LEN26_009091 [Aphanomyces euteiches]KAH9162485.1 hypothetical protein AeNC1_018832 [Aphanomyces euteiches]
MSAGLTEVCTHVTNVPHGPTWTKLSPGDENGIIAIFQAVEKRMPRKSVIVGGAAMETGRWTRQEHERYLKGMELFPYGPWKYVAEAVQTRTERQIRTHDQKFKARIARQEQRRRRQREGLMAREMMEPIEFANAEVQYDESIEFLVDALGDELLDGV